MSIHTLPVPSRRERNADWYGRVERTWALLVVIVVFTPLAAVVMSSALLLAAVVIPTVALGFLRAVAAVADWSARR